MFSRAYWIENRAKREADHLLGKPTSAKNCWQKSSGHEKYINGRLIAVKISFFSPFFSYSMAFKKVSLSLFKDQDVFLKTQRGGRTKNRRMKNGSDW